MKVYWLKLRNYGPSLGFGITARDLNDAMSLLSIVARTSVDATMLESWKELQTADELDQNHVVPNMGVIVRRGVWFPNMPEVQ